MFRLRLHNQKMIAVMPQSASVYGSKGLWRAVVRGPVPGYRDVGRTEQRHGRNSVRAEPFGAGPANQSLTAAP